SGFCNNLVTLFKSILTGRKQYVTYNGYRSFLYECSSGVVQGSNLGPTLFLIFINDLVQHISHNCKIFMYADDVKLATIIDNMDDCIDLQNDINSFVNWCTSNFMLAKTWLSTIKTL